MFIFRNLYCVSCVEVSRLTDARLILITQAIQCSLPLIILMKIFRAGSLSDIAERFHLNPSYFSKRFKTVIGTGFKEYINNLRITKSEKMLLETNKNITEIAFECGFENSNYYGDAFKQKNGVSPTEYRKLKGNIK